MLTPRAESQEQGACDCLLACSVPQPILRWWNQVARNLSLTVKPWVICSRSDVRRACPGMNLSDVRASIGVRRAS